ncbi:hypothetical protein ARTHRO9V_100091 [Arthrobacter sp. 9V]|nr:hypothetical protein ARTHRO9V_100091 [Arthrobacter sp. 9V]
MPRQVHRPGSPSDRLPCQLVSKTNNFDFRIRIRGGQGVSGQTATHARIDGHAGCSQPDQLLKLPQTESQHASTCSNERRS